MRDRVRRARLHAVPAENAARIIDVIHAGIALARRNPLGVGVLRGFDIDTIRGAGRRAQEAAHALLQTTLVAMRHVNAAITRLKIHRLVRIVLRHRLPEDVSEGDTESLRERAERLGNFTEDVRHVSSLTNQAGARQTVRQPAYNP